jgi:quinoprotein glucose dehydrogenase
MRGATPLREQIFSMPCFLLAAALATAAVGLAKTSPSQPAPDTLSPSAALSGNPAAGKEIFDGSGKCLSCHQAGASGSILGPNLSNVGAQLPPDQLRQWLLNPTQNVEPQFRLYEVVTRSGKTVRGRLLNQGPFSLQMLDLSGQLVAFSRSQVRDAHFVDPPPMPSYQGKLTSARIDDLVAYLESLRTPRDQ